MNDLINVAPTRKKKFLINTTPFKLEFNKRKDSSPIIRKLDVPVGNKAVEGFSSKPSGVDFDVVTDKPSKNESPRSSKTENCHVIEVEQTVEHFDAQVNTRRKIQTALIESTNSTESKTVQQNNKEWRKGTTLILGDSGL